jgi:pyrroline-5-carboxylate reductase
MQISIIGAGRMARVFAGQWQRLGHDIFIGARDITKARELALEVGPAVHHGTIEAAADAGDMILLAVKEAGAVQRCWQPEAAALRESQSSTAPTASTRSPVCLSTGSPSPSGLPMPRPKRMS